MNLACQSCGNVAVFAINRTRSEETIVFCDDTCVRKYLDLRKEITCT